MSSKPSPSLADELKPYVAPFRFDGSGEFHLKSYPTAEKGGIDKDAGGKIIEVNRKRLNDFQEKLYAQVARELESQVEAATAQLRDLDRAKSEFLSVVSHEIRTPLTALQGFSELLLSGSVGPERARRCLVHLHGEAQRLGRIVAELLDLARIESAQDP